jgi:hypothetical protein
MGRRTRRSKTNTTFFLDIAENESEEKPRKWKKTDKWKSPWM